MTLQRSAERFILSPRMGESPAQPDKGATGGGQFSRMFNTIYAAERKSRNAGSFLRKELGGALRNT